MKENKRSLELVCHLLLVLHGEQPMMNYSEKSEEFKSKTMRNIPKNPKLFRDFQNTYKDHLGPNTINNTCIHLITKMTTWKNGTTKVKSEIKLK